MAISPLAGKPAPKELLVDVARLEREYFERKPDLGDSEPAGQLRNQRASRDISEIQKTFTETHILAITQAICEYRKAEEWN